MFETNAKGESEFWRVALFRCLEKAKTLPVLPETVFALLLLFYSMLERRCVVSAIQKKRRELSILIDTNSPTGTKIRFK